MGKDGIVQHKLINNLPLGRNVDEAIRILNALQFTEEYDEVSPANWNNGDKAMTPTADGVTSYLAANEA